jgi:addiction module HigA family antidote
MHNPPHPGEFIADVYMEPFGYSCRYVAKKLSVSASTPEMALRLSKTLGRTPESWLAMQDNYDLWQAKQSINLAEVERIDFAVA